MADPVTPHFVNDIGAEKVHIGVRKFNCMGAHPPYDHPHVFLEMGSDDQIICPYCSTLYIYDSNLEPQETDPPFCFHEEEDAA